MLVNVTLSSHHHYEQFKIFTHFLPQESNSTNDVLVIKEKLVTFFSSLLSIHVANLHNVVAQFKYRMDNYRVTKTPQVHHTGNFSSKLGCVLEGTFDICRTELFLFLLNHVPNLSKLNRP